MGQFKRVPLEILYSFLNRFFLPAAPLKGLCVAVVEPGLRTQATLCTEWRIFPQFISLFNPNRQFSSFWQCCFATINTNEANNIHSCITFAFRSRVVNPHYCNSPENRPGKRLKMRCNWSLRMLFHERSNNEDWFPVGLSRALCTSHQYNTSFSCFLISSPDSSTPLALPSVPCTPALHTTPPLPAFMFSPWLPLCYSVFAATPEIQHRPCSIQVDEGILPHQETKAEESWALWFSFSLWEFDTLQNWTTLVNAFKNY